MYNDGFWEREGGSLFHLGVKLLFFPYSFIRLNSGIIRGSTIMVWINEAATVYLKDLEAKNQNKFLS